MGRAGTALYTSNGGLEWKKVKTETNKDIFAVDFYDKDNGWLVGASGLVLRTTKAGQSWERAEIVVPLFPGSRFETPTNFKAVKLINSKVGLIGGQDVIVRATSDSAEWKKEPVRGAVIGFIKQADNTLWAISDNGQNACSTDAGLTWSPCTTVKSEIDETKNCLTSP